MQWRKLYPFSSLFLNQVNMEIHPSNYKIFPFILRPKKSSSLLFFCCPPPFVFQCHRDLSMALVPEKPHEKISNSAHKHKLKLFQMFRLREFLQGTTFQISLTYKVVTDALFFCLPKLGTADLLFPTSKWVWNFTNKKKSHISKL